MQGAFYHLDHKNLQYIRSAKRLNSRQSQGAFFKDDLLSSRFQEHQALSCMFDPSERQVFPAPILPEGLVVGMIVWEI